MSKKLDFHEITFGCDPEFFFSKDGRVLGAEKVLPEEGIIFHSSEYARNAGAQPSKVIIDGVQAELNPRPNSCRELLGAEIAMCFRKLSDTLKSNSGVGIDFHQTIKLDKQDMSVLSDKSKKFGCMPSKNAHLGGKESRIGVDPAIYNYRSAGGHIHIGNFAGNKIIKEVLLQPERLVKMMDVIVGNTCVLVDRDQGNIERRKVYGRAGEFRTPPHGVEYRTLSNFWLRSYPLMSMVMGLTRTAVMVVASGRDEELLDLIEMDDITKAINTNDFRLALSNFKKIEKALMDMVPEDDFLWDINPDTIHLFRHFVKKGLDYWFPQPPLAHWTHLTVSGYGFSSFLLTDVADDKARKSRT